MVLLAGCGVVGCGRVRRGGVVWGDVWILV